MGATVLVARWREGGLQGLGRGQRNGRTVQQEGAAAAGLGGPGRYSVDAALGWDAYSGAIFVPLAALAVIVDALVMRYAPVPAAPRREEQRPEPGARRAA